MRFSARWRLAAGLMLLVVLFFAGSYLYPRVQMAAQPFSVSDIGAGGRENLYFQLVKPSGGLLHRLGVDDEDWQRQNADAYVMTVNAHSGDIRDWDLGERLSVQDESGVQYPVSVTKQLSSQHHTTWLTLVPSRDQNGELFSEREGGQLDFVIADASSDGRARVLTMPLGVDDSVTSPWMAYVVVPLAVAGVLMYSVSPCAIGNFAIASVITAASPTRRRRWTNIGAFGIGYIAALLLAGITFLILGSRIEAEPYWLRRIELVGGFVIAALGLWLLTSPGVGLFNGVMDRVYDRAGREAARADAEGGISATGSFILGIGLSLGCASCVGIVGLTLLMPLLTMLGAASMSVVFAAFGILAFGYLLPFVLVVTGLPEGLTLRRRVSLERWLRAGSGVMMLALAALFIAGASHAMTSFEWAVMGWGEDVVSRGLQLLGI